MTEERVLQKSTPGKPSLWDQALRAVKGDSTSELVEQFTQEMTLVAEGLCEDQARLRRAVDGLIKQAEQEHGRTTREYDDLSQLIDQQNRDMGKRLDELSKRLEKIEAEQKEARHKAARGGKLSLWGGDVIGRVTLLASIVCGTWLLTTILNVLM